MLLLKLKLFFRINSAFLSKSWAGSVSGKHSYRRRLSSSNCMVCSAWRAWGDTAMHLKTVPLTLAVGVQQIFRVRVGHFPSWIGPKPKSLLCQHIPCIRGLFSGSARMTGLTYLQFERENSQMTKEAMFHFSLHMLSYSFPLEMSSYLKVKAYWDVWAAPSSYLKTEPCVQWLFTALVKRRHLQSENRWIN